MTSQAKAASVKNRRPVGRPRGDGKPHLTRQRVFEICAKLIAEHGFAGTSIRMMATALDSSPASLFNLFGSKDGLLNALITHAAQLSLSFYDELTSLDAEPGVLLYKSIYEEVVAVTSADQDFVRLFYLPELRKPEYAAAQAMRKSMVDHYSGLIEECISLGVLQTAHPELAAEQVFQLTETSILAPRLLEVLSPEEQAGATADFCFRAMQCNEAKLENIRQKASGISLHIAFPEGA